MTKDYERIEKAILFLDKNFRHQPTLLEIAKAVNLSVFHFQRLFKRWAGITPKRFLQILTIEHAKKVMAFTSSLLNIAYESGLSGGGRLHDLFVNLEAMTPDEFRSRGKDLQIHYGFHPSPFGECFIAVTSRGICRLDFMTSSDRKKLIIDLEKKWPFARLMVNSAVTKPYIDRVFGSSAPSNSLPLHIEGTNFQIKVWKALLNIPRGVIVSYENIATRIGQPKAIRAVAKAIAYNPVAFAIPCHRVIRKTGAVSGYRWGVARKKAILVWESGNKN